MRFSKEYLALSALGIVCATPVSQDNGFRSPIACVLIVLRLRLPLSEAKLLEKHEV